MDRQIGQSSKLSVSCEPQSDRDDVIIFISLISYNSLLLGTSDCLRSPFMYPSHTELYITSLLLLAQNCCILCIRRDQIMSPTHDFLLSFFLQCLNQSISLIPNPVLPHFVSYSSLYTSCLATILCSKEFTRTRRMTSYAGRYLQMLARLAWIAVGSRPEQDALFSLLVSRLSSPFPSFTLPSTYSLFSLECTYLLQLNQKRSRVPASERNNTIIESICSSFNVVSPLQVGRCKVTVTCPELNHCTRVMIQSKLWGRFLHMKSERSDSSL